MPCSDPQRRVRAGAVWRSRHVGSAANARKGRGAPRDAPRIGHSRMLGTGTATLRSPVRRGRGSLLAPSGAVCGLVSARHRSEFMLGIVYLNDLVMRLRSAIGGSYINIRLYSTVLTDS